MEIKKKKNENNVRFTKILSMKRFVFDHRMKMIRSED